MSDTQWTEIRCNQLAQLEELLREVRLINSGSHCLERIRRCMELAELLDEWNLNGRGPNFRMFLRDLAISDRRATLDAARSGEGR